MQSLSLGLSLLIALPLNIPPAEAQNLPMELNIVVVEGEGAITTGGQRASREPFIRVEDENHKPVAKAAVVFTLPTEGASGQFGNGAKTVTIMTDSAGEAKGQGLRVNQIGGKLPILVAVSYRGLTARTTITEYIEAKPGAKAEGGGHGKLIAILAVVGAAAAGGAVYATQRRTSSGASQPGPTSIGITPGTGTIAPPH